LAEAAEGEGELGVDEDGGGGEAAVGGGELGGEGELEAELRLAGTALANKLRDGMAGNATVEAAIQYGTADGALLAAVGQKQKVLWPHLAKNSGI